MKKTIGKRLLSLLLLCALLLSTLLLSGCHGNTLRLPPNDLPPEHFDSQTPVEITFWAKTETNIRQTRIYQKAIADFEALYPNVTVKLSLYTDYSRIYNDVITNIATGTTPNVCITYPDHIATYKTGENVVLPLDGWIADEAFGLGGSELRFDGPTREELLPKFLAEGVLDGKQYALPFMRSTEACYVNKTYVESLGYTLPEVLTWDFVWEVSEAAMKKNPDGTYVGNGQSVLIPFIYKSTDNMMIQMLKQKDAGFSDEEGNILLFNDTTEELLLEIAEHAKNRAFSTFKISSYPGNYFNKGQCIFAVDSTAGSTWLGSDAPLLDIDESQVRQFETVVLPVPQFDPQNPQMISQGPSLCLFNKENEQEVLASWLFAQYLLTNDIQTSYARTEGYVPVTSKAQASPEYLDYLARSGEDNDEFYSIKIDATRLLLENTENSFITPVFNGSASLRQAAGELIEGVTKAVRSQETVDDAFLDELKHKVNSLYRLDQIRRDNQRDPQPLSPPAILLLSVLGGTWLLLGGALILQRRKKGKRRNNP